jgi:hypothetical protein
MACNCGSKNDWNATLNEMPLEPRRLAVTGTAECTTTGYRNVRLEPVRPGGVNERICLLELKWDEPTGGAGDKVTSHQVTYDERDCPAYSEVEIVNCDHKKIKVKVVS